MKKNIILFAFLSSLTYASNNFYYEDGEKVYLTPVNSSISSTFSNSKLDLYNNDNGILIGISSKLIIKTKSNTDLNKYLKEFNVSLVSNLGDNLYLLDTKDKSKTLIIANSLTLKSDIEFAQPDFYKKRLER